MGDFDIERRAAILAEGNRLQQLYREVGYTPGGKDAIYKVLDLHDEYRRMLPDLLIARCPLTDRFVRWPLDNVDLDGWYWDRDQPVRRRPVALPGSWLVTQGAVRLVEPLTPAPFDCIPGPGAPFVSPHLLEQNGIRAVIAEVPIGRHTGWAITYFASKRPKDISLEDIWGTRTNEILDPTGLDREYAEQLPGHRVHDFDLGPWLDTGKLLWIAPGDASATLHEGSADCPFLGIEGDHREQRITRGEVFRY